MRLREIQRQTKVCEELKDRVFDTEIENKKRPDAERETECEEKLGETLRERE